MFYWRESDLGGMRQLLMVFILPLFIVLHALWPESISTASPLCSLLAALYKIPGFLSTVPAHCLTPSCPLSQTGMTMGTLPAAQCSNVSKAGSGRCGVGGWGGLTNRSCHVRQGWSVGRAGKAYIGHNGVQQA